MDLILDDARLKRVWNQKAIPVILRRMGRREKLRARLPYADDNRAWLRNKRRHRPEWVDELHCWEIPKAWLNDFVDRALQRYPASTSSSPIASRRNVRPPASTR